jgi:hypothetical protein
MTEHIQLYRNFNDNLALLVQESVCVSELLCE